MVKLSFGHLWAYIRLTTDCWRMLRTLFAYNNKKVH